MIYLALTLTSTLAKLLAFTQLRKIYNASTLHKFVLVFIIMLIAQSTFELALYFYASDPDTTGAYYALVGYYVFLFIVIAFMPFVALAAANKNINIYMLIATFTAVGVIIYALLFTNWLILDVKLAEVTRSLTKISGPYYVIFQVAVLLSVLFTIIVLSPHNRYEDYFIRTRTTNLFIAFLPGCLFAIFIVIAMALGSKLNAVGVISLCFLIYVAALVHNSHPYRKPDYLVFLPFSKKNKILMNTIHQLMYSQDSTTKKALDAQLIDYYLAQPGLAQKDVAKMLNISESTLSRRKNQK